MSIYHQEYPQQEDEGVGVYLEDSLFKKTKTKTKQDPLQIPIGQEVYALITCCLKTVTTKCTTNSNT